jgi:hypothetical protein
MKKKFGFVMAVAALIVILLSSGSAFAYTVTGYVNNPGEYSTGGSLWTILQGTDTTFGENTTYPYQYPCFTDPTLPCITLPQPPYVQNDINHNYVDTNYVIVTGKDGSRAIYSVGELNPKFSPNTAQITLTCTSGNKKGRGCDKNDHCDLAGAGRTVKNVSNIEVVHATPSIHYNGKEGGAAVPFTHFYSSQIVVSGHGIMAKTYDLADLQAMNQVTFDASLATNNTQGLWTGPTLLDLLKNAGVNTKDMDSYIVVQATDGYATALTMYEATKKPGVQYDMLAISGLITFQNTPNVQILNCGTTCSKYGDSGLARLVLPYDNVAGRWVSNVSQIVVYKSHHKNHH